MSGHNFTSGDTDSDGVLEQRTYEVQNWRHDVVALAESDGDLIEQTECGAHGSGTRPVSMSRRVCPDTICIRV
ncbi:MAG: hypothetical protein Tsb0013_19360 [Phycisphaerales bacterium]